MKRYALLKHLEQHGCRLEREGGRHAIYKNPAGGGVKAPVPRHNEIDTAWPSESASNWAYHR